MEFRAETGIGAVVIALAFAVPALAAGRDLSYQAWHGHSRPPHVRKAGNLGTLVIADAGVSFEETYKAGKKPKHPHAWRWAWQDIQQLTMTPDSLTVLTYKDNKWKLGADREFHFDLRPGESFEEAYEILKGRLDQRFVAAIPARPANPLWELPVKHLLRMGGDEGVLEVSPERIVFRSVARGQSRAWRYEDIDNISLSGPFELTITTFERARTHYGNRKDFNFQLRQRLDEARYNDLWRRLNRSKGLAILQENTP